MFGIGRWFKKTKIGQHFEKAKDQLEGLFDDAGFKEVFDEVKEALEVTINQLELKIGVTGASKWAMAQQWLEQTYPRSWPFIAMFRRWVTAYVEMKKAQGLWV